MLLLLPTATVLAVMGLVEALTTQRLLFASLASSAFLIYLDPRHPANGARTLLTAQPAAALLGFGAAELLGRGHPSTHRADSPSPRAGRTPSSSWST